VTEVELVRHELEGRIREHADAIEKLTAERERYRALYMELLERCKLLEKGIVVGKKAERFTAGDDPQLALQILEMMLAGRDVVVEEVEEEVEPHDAEDEDADDAEVDRPAPARRRSRGRRPLPENLPRGEEAGAGEAALDRQRATTSEAGRRSTTSLMTWPIR
jgi:transposase